MGLYTSGLSLAPLTDVIGCLLWPTPRVTESTMKARRPSLALVSRKRSHGWDMVEALWDAAHTHHQVWPGIIHPGEIAVGHVIAPQWWEWLMGFPLGWTDLDVSETPPQVAELVGRMIMEVP